MQGKVLEREREREYQPATTSSSHTKHLSHLLLPKTNKAARQTKKHPKKRKGGIAFWFLVVFKGLEETVARMLLRHLFGLLMAVAAALAATSSEPYPITGVYVDPRAGSVPLRKNINDFAAERGAQW